MSSIREEAILYHQTHRGKIAVHSKVPLNDAYDLSLAYTPGVAEPCLEIAQDRSKVYDYTSKGNLVAIVTDGTAVLGLGDIGPHAAIPVMEGKAILFKAFAGIDAFPICLNTTDPDKIVETVMLLEPMFGGIHLEDIASPQCFQIEAQLKKEIGIPVFHDDQHGTAIVTAAGLINAAKLAGKAMCDLRIVVNGAGAAGIAVSRLLLSLGVRDLVICDRSGIIYKGREVGMNWIKEEAAGFTNPSMLQGTLTDAIRGADVFIGLSSAGALTREMILQMNADPIVFAMANPVPEIMPDEAIAAGVKVIGTGRSDFPNQINNVLAFPGIFRGALDAGSKEINEEMKVAAVHAIANLVSDEELHAKYVIPQPFDPRVTKAVAIAVAGAARKSGAAASS